MDISTGTTSFILVKKLVSICHFVVPTVRKAERFVVVTVDKAGRFVVVTVDKAGRFVCLCLVFCFVCSFWRGARTRRDLFDWLFPCLFASGNNY